MAVLVRLAEGRVESTALQTVPSTRLEIFIGSGSWSCLPPAHTCLPVKKVGYRIIMIIRS